MHYIYNKVSDIYLWWQHIVTSFCNQWSFPLVQVIGVKIYNINITISLHDVALVGQGNEK